MKSLELKTQDEKDQGFSVQKMIAVGKPRKFNNHQNSQEKWVKDYDCVRWRI